VCLLRCDSASLGK